MHRTTLLLILAMTQSMQFATARSSFANAEDLPEPPMAKVVPKRLESHGDVRVDNYYWLKDRDNPEVLAYLEAENEYAEAATRHTAALQDRLYEEIVGRIQQDDDTVPYRKDQYFYYVRYDEGDEYGRYCRKKGSLEATEEVLLDGNRLSAGSEFFSLAGFEVSPDHRLALYATDTVGRRFYTLRVRDLESGQDLPDLIEGVTGNSAWAADNRTLFYVRQHPETLRWYQLYRHTLGTDPSQDELVYQEDDEEFSIYVTKTKSEEFIVLAVDQTESSEVHVLAAARPHGAFVKFAPREPKHEFAIDHAGGTFYILTNWQAKNFRLMKTDQMSGGRQSWIEVQPHSDDVLIEDFELFDDHLVIVERQDGLSRLRIRRHSDSAEHFVDFGESAFTAYLGDNPEFRTHKLRYEYSSLATPESVIDYDMESREKTVLKQEKVLGDFDASRYSTERIWATATDGTKVPISLVYRKNLRRPDQPSPLLLYGYGSYGATIDPSFRSYRLSLIDRGFIFAIAHVRGGQELGREWYEDGRLLRKKNTFTDFVDCARHLIANGYTVPELLFAEGGSAGGLLMGAVTNLAPELFRGILNHVGFVDVVTTMLEPEIPLTTGEYDEWGDPRERVFYDYMLSYSPYDNLIARRYPNLLVTTGLHDSQVQYWEPTKYVAKLRSLKQDDNLLLLFTNMEAGHGGASGRLKQHRETARDYAFLLDLAGIDQ